jgi:DNA repair exonuclease SbcCD ATPase subunit
MDALEAEVLRLLDRGTEVKSLLLPAETDAEGLDALDTLMEELERASRELTGLLGKITGLAGDLDFKRFRDFVRHFDHQKSVAEFSSSLEEEFGRFRSVFPAAEELERRREKILYDVEQEMATLAALSARLDGLEREKKRVAPRLKAHLELMEKVGVLEARLTPMEHDIAVRRALTDLFGGTVTNIKNRFGPAIGRVVSSILPLLTKERYGKVQISSDLDIAIFSRERNDFTVLEEVSGGTRDQVLVCLRLALAQSLLHTRKGEDRRQFLFLDEPISSFDEERSLLFLDLVKEFNASFQQIFVAIHMVKSTPQAYQGIIQTHLEEDRLDIDLG